jgi:hypothetical protein
VVALPGLPPLTSLSKEAISDRLSTKPILPWGLAKTIDYKATKWISRTPIFFQIEQGDKVVA